MKKTELEAMQEAWNDYPSQDNEGYQPDRGGFKCGWFAALKWKESKESEELRSLRWFHWEIMKRVIPGQTDSHDAAKDFLNELRASRTMLQQSLERLNKLTPL